jgi:hypothetical protein
VRTSRLANNLREDTWTVPNFEDAAARHRMIAAIETAANTGTQQSYEARTTE